MSSSSAPDSLPSTHPPPGTVVAGKYRIGQSLGAGGMGVVVEARHLQLGEAVALKFLHGHLASGSGDHLERFLREARATARIKSEHVARVLDVDTLPGGEPFMVMELLIGEDLEQVSAERGPLPVAETVECVMQACHAIAEAHQHGIVHRDLKPANLFLTRRADGSPLVKVLDFGISRWVDGWDQALTATGEMLGTPLYMAPEQIRDSRRADARSDIWALGVVLYQLLTRRTPFAGHNSAATLAKIMGDPVPPLQLERPDVAPELEGIVVRCLEKSPAERFQRVEELMDALAAARPRVLAFSSSVIGAPASPPIVADPGSALPSGEATGTAGSVMKARQAPGRSRLWAAAAVLLAAALCVGVGVTLRWRAPRAAADASASGAAPASASAVLAASSASASIPPLAPPGSAEAPAPALAPAPASASASPPPSSSVRPSKEPGGGAAQRRGIRRVTPVAPRLPTVPRYGQD
jgi:serine/threonine protein kinase